MILAVALFACAGVGRFTADSYRQILAQRIVAVLLLLLLKPAFDGSKALKSLATAATCFGSALAVPGLVELFLFSFGGPVVVYRSLVGFTAYRGFGDIV